MLSPRMCIKQTSISYKLVSNYIYTIGRSTQQHLVILGKLCITFESNDTFVDIVK